MTDVVNGVNVEQMNEMVQSIEHNPLLGKATFHATSTWMGGGNVKTKIREFTLEGDEPPELLGTNLRAEFCGSSAARTRFLPCR